MNSSASNSFSLTNRDQRNNENLLDDLQTELIKASLPSKPIMITFRDGHGRYTKGCPPGPGRPRKFVPRRHVAPVQLIQRGTDMLDAKLAWDLIVSRFGPDDSRKLLENVEAEYGPICFRHLALAAITAGQQTANAELTAKYCPPKRSSKRKSKKHSSQRKKTRPKTARRRRSLPTHLEDTIMHDSPFDVDLW